MQQHNPKAFWNGTFQSHANSASAVLGAVLVADNPTDHHIFLSAFTGERELHSTSAGVAARTPRGDVEIIEPVAFRDRYGIIVGSDGEGMTLAGLRIGVLRPDAVEACAGRNGIVIQRHLNALVTGPAAACGATLIFEKIEG